VYLHSIPILLFLRTGTQPFSGKGSILSARYSGGATGGMVVQQSSLKRGIRNGPPPDVEQCLLSDKQFQLQLYTHVSWLWVRAISPQTWMTDIAAVGQMWPMGHIYLFI